LQRSPSVPPVDSCLDNKIIGQRTGGDQNFKYVWLDLGVQCLSMAFVSNQRFALAETYLDQTGFSDEFAIEPSLGRDNSCSSSSRALQFAQVCRWARIFSAS
jgi:hypothetical protein